MKGSRYDVAQVACWLAANSAADTMVPISGLQAAYIVADMM